MFVDRVFGASKLGGAEIVMYLQVPGQGGGAAWTRNFACSVWASQPGGTEIVMCLQAHGQGRLPASCKCCRPVHVDWFGVAVL